MAVIDLLFLPFQRHVEVLASDRQKIGLAINAYKGKENNCGNATLLDLHPKKTENISPTV
jgi:hypothetical protein